MDSGGHDGITLDVDGLGPVAARYAIGADGMWSPLRKALGVPDEAATSASGTPSGSTSPASPRGAELWVWFEPDLLPGYAWSFPLPGGRANVGYGIPRVRARRPSR